MTQTTTTKKVKQVFDTNEVAHIWAHQNQSSGRNSGGNFYFSGATIFSYDSHFPIATIADENTVFLTMGRYSNTTAKHIAFVRQAISHKKVIYCYDVPVYLEYASNKHENNIAYWKRQIKSLFDELGNKKIRNTQSRIDDINYNFRLLNEYVSYFKIDIEDSELLTLLAISKSDNFINEAREAKAKIEAVKKEKLEEAVKAYENYIALWKKFDTEGIKNLGVKSQSLCNYYVQNESVVYTRLRYNEADEIIETSKGVKIPAAIAKRAFVTLNGCFCNDCDNLKIPVMGYTITQSSKQSVIAGCHNVPNGDIKEIADLLNW